MTVWLLIREETSEIIHFCVKTDDDFGNTLGLFRVSRGTESETYYCIIFFSLGRKI